jgi:hypothetical protein
MTDFAPSAGGSHPRHPEEFWIVFADVIPTPVGMPAGLLDPEKELEETPGGLPVVEHVVNTVVGFRVVRLRDGRTLAAWHEEIGTDGWQSQPAAAPSPSQPRASAPPPRAWQAVRDELGAAFLRRLEAAGRAERLHPTPSPRSVAPPHGSSSRGTVP